MTVSETRNKLLEHFLTNTYFCDIEHLEKFDVGAKNKVKPELKSALILAALRDLESHKMLRNCSSEGYVFWVLEQPIQSYPQNVLLSVNTTSLVADTINIYRDVYNVSGDFCDKLKIKEEDIQNLCFIIKNLMSKVKPNE